MKKTAKLDPIAERPDIDFSKGARRKYSNLLAKGTNIAVIDPALQEHFPDSESVNRALRALLTIREPLQTVSHDAPSTKRKVASRAKLPNQPPPARQVRAPPTTMRLSRMGRFVGG